MTIREGDADQAADQRAADQADQADQAADDRSADPTGADDDRSADPTGADDDTRWVAFVRADDTTGTIAALAGVFSARGVSVGSLATGSEQGSSGLVVVTFRTGERRQRMLTRTVERLPMVRGLVVRRADDLGVRAAAVVHLPPGVEFRPPPRTTVRWSGRTAYGEPLLVEGALVDVEEVVTAARAAGATGDALAIQPPPGRPTRTLSPDN